MQSRNYAVMLIVMIALSGASVAATGVQTSPVQNVESQNVMVAEVSVNATPTVSNSKQRRQYRLAYVSWKNRIADLRMSAIFLWLRTEYYPSLVSIADAASSGSSSVSFARDSMTIQDAWWDLDESMDMELHRDSFYDAFEHLMAASDALLSVRNTTFSGFTKEDEEAIRMPHSVYEKFNAQIARLEEDIREEKRRQEIACANVGYAARDSMQPRLIKVIEKNRETGTYVEVDYGLSERHVYQATCYGTSTENHGFYVNADRYKDIVALASYPSNWCPKCQENHDARDSKTMKYTHYVQNESHLGIDVIEGNTKDELIASLFDHIASTSGYHEITKKMALESIFDDEADSYPESLRKDVEEMFRIHHARDSKYMVVSSQDGDEFGACLVEGSGKYRFVQFRGSQTYPANQIRFKNKDEAIEFLCNRTGYGNYFWVKSDYYVKSWWNGVDGKLYNYSECHNELQSKYNARDSADSDSHTIDLTPSPKGYASMLKILINCSPIAANVEWATAELEAWEKAHPEIVARDSAWDDEKLSYAIELLSEKDLVKYQEWVDSQDGDWNDDGTISFTNANAKLHHDMWQLRKTKLNLDMGYCRETELLLCNLERHGFTLVGHRPHGYDLIEFNRTLDDEGNMPSNHYDIQNIIYDCWNHEQTTLIVNHPSRGDREIGILLVYGNEFGVLAANYSAPKDWLADPEWYVALRSAANTDIDSIEEYEAITGSSMEYRWSDNLGRMSGKITFDDIMEDGYGYGYKLCPECLKSGHENNQSYCHRYGASLSNGDTGCCIGYPSEEIARDSVDENAVHIDLVIKTLQWHDPSSIVAEQAQKFGVYVPEYEGQSKLKQIEMMKRVKLEHFYDLEHFAKITNERLENARLHLGSIVKRIDELGGGINDEDRRFLDDDEARDSVDERMTLSGSEAVQKDHYVVGNIIAKMTKKELIDELLGCFGLDHCLENGYVVQIADSARDSADSDRNNRCFCLADHSDFNIREEYCDGVLMQIYSHEGRKYSFCRECNRTEWVSARDSAEMAALVPSRYDENVPARELHPNVSLLNPDGFKWSDEQLHILNDFASWFQEYEDGTKPTRPRMVIESVAGSGKTTLVKELLSIINRFDSATKTIASAFNKHIAEILKEEIKNQQKNGFRGLEILGSGSSATNSVSAGGYSIIKSHAELQGISNVSMEGVEGKYLVLSKIVLAEFFAMISKPDGVKNANVGEVIRIMKEVCDFSQESKPRYRNQYMKLARDLKKFVEALMGQGFVPTRSESMDLKEIRRIYEQIALVQGLNDTVLLKLPKNALFLLARNVLLRSMDTWNSEKEVFPFAWTKNYSFSDVIVARVSGFAEGNEFERAKFDSNNLYPLWKTLPRSVWSSDDKKLKTNMLFDHLSKAGLVWPPRSKESGKPTVSAPTGKPACEVWVRGNQMTIDFNSGRMACLKFKIRNKHSGETKQIKAWEFLKSKGAKTDGRSWTMDYNETILKKYEDKYKNTKHGFKLHGSESGDAVIEESRSKVTVSFSDHTWLPIALNLEPSADVKKDFCFVDEIQDLSVAKGSLIRKLIRNDGDSGLVLVGDSRQSIMQFSGSSATSMTDNAVASNCVSYPMTICWRGSHEVAHSANRVMSNVLEEVQNLWPETDFPDYLSHKSPSIETWPVGKPMENVGTDKLVPMVKELQEENPDVEIAVLSRVNQPLGAVILDLVTNGISITTPSGKDGIVNSIKPILINKYVEPKSPSQGIGVDMDNTNFKDLRSVRNRLEQVVSWAFNQSMIRNKGDADAAAKDEKFVTIEGNAELAIALIELWFREGVPSSTKHKDFVDWFNNVLLSSSGNPVHVSSVHRFKGGECDYAFILRSAKGKPDKETGECMPREIFMNKSMFDAPENAIAEACIMYVAMTRAKQKNVNLWWEKSGEEEVVQDNAPRDSADFVKYEIRNLDTNETMIIKLSKDIYNAERNTNLVVTNLETGEQDINPIMYNTDVPEYYKKGSDDYNEWVSALVWKADPVGNTKWEKEHGCRDSADYRKQLEARDGIDRVYCLVCDKCYQSKDGSPIGFTIRYCCGQETEINQEKIDFLVEYSSKPRDSYVSEECNIQNGSEQYIQGEQNFDRRTAGHRCDREIWDKLSLEMRGLRMQIQEHLREAHWNWRYYPLHNGTHPYDVAMARVESLLGAYENCLDWIDETADQEVSKPRDSNDIRHELEQAGFLPANGATRVCCNCEKQAVFDVDTAIGTRSFCSEKCYAEYNGLEVMDDPNFYGMMLITRKPIETVYEVHLWTREIEGKKLGEFDEFFKFKNEESARKLYNQITDYTYKILMQYDGDEGDVLLEYDNHDPHENMGHRDSNSWCNCKYPKTRINTITGGEVTIKDGTIADFHSDYLVSLVSVYCEVCGVEITQNRDSTNAYIDECPECAENTCLNNVSTNPKYHDIECYSCGYYSIQKTILISTPPYRQTKQIDGYMSEEEIEEMRADMGVRDSQKVYVITGRCEDYSEYRELDNYGVFSSLTLARKAMHELFKQSLKEYNYDQDEPVSIKEAKTKYWQEHKWNNGNVEVSFWKPDYDIMLIELKTDYLDYSFGTWAIMNDIDLNDAKDSVDFCNTCDAHIDLQGRDMLPRGMCIDCFIAQRKEEMGIPNPIITDNWPENDPDEEPRDSSEFVSITLEEMDNFLVDAQGFRRLDPDDVGHYCGEWVYEYYLEPTNSRIRVYSSIPVAIKTTMNHNYSDDFMAKFVMRSRGKGKDAIRCILLTGLTSVGSDEKCIGKATSTKRITLWRLNLLKKYEQWIWDALA